MSGMVEHSLSVGMEFQRCWRGRRFSFVCPRAISNGWGVKLWLTGLDLIVRFLDLGFPDEVLFDFLYCTVTGYQLEIHETKCSYYLCAGVRRLEDCLDQQRNPSSSALRLRFLAIAWSVLPPYPQKAALLPKTETRFWRGHGDKI